MKILIFFRRLYRIIIVICVGYWNLLRKKLNKIPEEKLKLYNKRLDICIKCDYIKKDTGQCGICKCFIEAKTKVDYMLDTDNKSVGGCPMRYW